MNRITCLIFFLLTGNLSPILAMNIYHDPRMLPSYMDKFLMPEYDILRITANASPNNDLVFEVKTRGETRSDNTNDYLLLHILHEKSYILLVPMNRTSEDQLLIYTRDLQSAHNLLTASPQIFRPLDQQPGFSAKRVHHGVQFSIPLNWINFNHDFGYDAYTVRANIRTDRLQINEIYDQAGKGRKEAPQFSAITLLNRLCATRRK